MSNETVTLFNGGERVIECEGGIKFPPRKSMVFPKAIGDKLVRLFKGEVQNIQDALKPFEAAAVVAEPTDEEKLAAANAEEAERRGMSVAELVIHKAEVDKAMAEGLSREDAEQLVFGDQE